MGVEIIETDGVSERRKVTSVCGATMEFETIFNTNIHDHIYIITLETMFKIVWNGFIRGQNNQDAPKRTSGRLSPVQQQARGGTDYRLSNKI